MPQMDTETFVEYIYWIFLVLLHHYSSFYINSNFMKFFSRQFLVNHFYNEIRYLKEHENDIKTAFENFNQKKY